MQKTSINELNELDELQILDIKPWFEENRQILSNYIKDNFSGNIKILEAGCGQGWELDLKGVDYELTGIDLSEDALKIRKEQKKDLDEIIVGDLQTVDIKPESYDLIYSAYVLEHIEGAEKVLDNFFQWLKPKGVLILKIPDGDTIYGFATKYSPFWLHVFYKKYIAGHPNAGKPGHDPFPTFYDRVVSRRGMQEYCRRHGLKIKMEYSFALKNPQEIFNFHALAPIGSFIYQAIGLLSFGKLVSNRTDLVYVIEKPE